jgi:signal transduction histidine kinase
LKSSTSEAVERLKVARDLHDTLAQEIAALGFTCDEAIALEPIGASRSSLLEIRSKLSLLSTTLRDEIALLRDEERSFVEMLDGFVREVNGTSGISITNTAADCFALAPTETVELFRAAREILTNILTHSGATSITISSRTTSTEQELAITDDGNDYLISAIEPTHHFGAQGVRERVESLGGTMDYSRENSLNYYRISLSLC